MNKYHLLVFEELKENDYFFKKNNLVTYHVPRDGESLSNNVIAGKVMAVWDLRNWGAITIHDQERFGEVLEYEFQILIEQPAFDSLYEKCVKEVAKIDLNKYTQQIETEKNSLALKRKLVQFVRLNIKAKKRKQLLLALSDFKPVFTSQLKLIVKSKNLAGLRIEVNKDLNGSGFIVESHKSKSIGISGEYQLIYNPISKKT